MSELKDSDHRAWQERKAIACFLREAFGQDTIAAEVDAQKHWDWVNRGGEPRSLASPGWREIGSAPKTSRHILVWTPANLCSSLVCWRDDDRGTYWVHAFGERLHDEPSHWMPLPLPPTEEPTT